MNAPPHRDQSFPFASNLQHHLAQIASADACDPIEPDRARTLQDDLRLATLAENVDMGRVVIVGKNHEPEAMGTVHRHH
jgi:hypothetical protein